MKRNSKSSVLRFVLIGLLSLVLVGMMIIGTRFTSVFRRTSGLKKPKACCSLRPNCSAEHSQLREERNLPFFALYTLQVKDSCLTLRFIC